MPRRLLWVAFAVPLLLGLGTRPAAALPVFAHRYHVSCQQCHTEIPHLNAFGAYFLANGYRAPGLQAGGAFPVAVKVNLVGSSAFQGSGPDGRGLPKEIVDEVELLTGGTAGTRANYFVEQYVVDGGEPGSLREAWLSERLVPWSWKGGVSLQAGQFTLALPVDPETFRETYQHYTLYDQTVGDNPFNFFDAKLGARAMAGDALLGTSASLFAGPGRDPQSGLPATGTDLELYGQHVAGPFTISAYRYQGARPIAPSQLDRFERTGYGASFAQGRWEAQAVLQTGWDSDAVPGVGAASSGGFLQGRYEISARLFALARYEGTSDSLGSFQRDGVVLLGYRPASNSRITVEDVMAHSPSTSNTLNVQVTVAY